MKDEKVIQEMIEQFKFDIEVDKVHMNPVDQNRIEWREHWIKCLEWVLSK